MTKRLFVGNLSFDTTEDSLRDAFAEWGASSAAIPTGETGRPRGFGFVEVDDDKAEAAITSMNGSMLDGRTITVNEARPRPERNGFGGGRSGGGRSFGGGGRFRGSRW
ncbi:MAG: RNA recognition motif domain-containing protein [Armatimonadota bacterium]